MVNLSFSFRTPSTSSYLLVPVNEREDRRLPTLETRTHQQIPRFQGCLLSLSHTLSPTAYLSLRLTHQLERREISGERVGRQVKDAPTLGDVWMVFIVGM